MSTDHDLIEGADWASASGRSLLRRLEAEADTWPWVPDIDDPKLENPQAPGGGFWTGKFYVGEEGHTWCTYNNEPREIHNVRLTQAMRSAIGPLSRRVEELEAEVIAERERWKAALAAERDEWDPSQHVAAGGARLALRGVLIRLGIAQ